ncbi:hypothetical protein R0137_03705 [Congregibacter brevis]|uniref:Transmembrane protein n=1 Tax=Congregibacter brevis TaxID=3081201 RepID=A0ABZ0IF01_9GAMM|nr:hypothetical protein R0137_03705 [Congregibacter sp. IMCC45268]
MTESQLIEIIYISAASAEAQFESWMAVTIALVVAAYTAGYRLNSKVRYMIAFLYVLICVLFYLRYDNELYAIGIHIQQLREMGSDFGAKNIALMRVIRSMVVIGATTLAVALIVSPRLGGQASDDT